MLLNLLELGYWRYFLLLAETCVTELQRSEVIRSRNVVPKLWCQTVQINVYEDGISILRSKECIRKLKSMHCQHKKTNSWQSPLYYKMGSLSDGQALL